MAKLTDDDVRAIRAEHAEGKWTRQDLAYIDDVSAATVSNAVRGEPF